MRAILLASAFALATTGAFAGEQYVDETGFAVSGYDVVAYHSLEQSPVGEAQPAAVPGDARYTFAYNGATWAFSTPENRDMFAADPAKYVPAYDGHCAYGVALEGKVPGNPNLWRIVDGTLYLNINQNVVGFWEEDIPGFISDAEVNWSGALESAPANDGPVPAFDVSAAPVQ